MHCTSLHCTALHSAHKMQKRAQQRGKSDNLGGGDHYIGAIIRTRQERQCLLMQDFSTYFSKLHLAA